MNIAEQIKSFEAKRAALAASLDEVMSKAAEEGRTRTLKKRATTTHPQKLNQLMRTSNDCATWKAIWHRLQNRYLKLLVANSPP